MKSVPKHVVERMMATMQGQTSDLLMRQFGISYNTWRKVRGGEPIRQSVAERLVFRVQTAAATK